MKLTLIVVVAVVALVAVTLIILGSVDIPAPSAQIERPVPASRLPH